MYVYVCVWYALVIMVKYNPFICICAILYLVFWMFRDVPFSEQPGKFSFF